MANVPVPAKKAVAPAARIHSTVHIGMQITRVDGVLVHVAGGCSKCQCTFTGKLSEIMDEIDSHVYLHALGGR